VKRRVFVGCGHQHIGIDDQHYLPPFHGLIKSVAVYDIDRAPPLRNVGKAVSRRRFFGDRNRLRSAVSTSSYTCVAGAPPPA
jgi:hypothetical protein